MMFLFVHPLTPMLREGDQKISLDDPQAYDRRKRSGHLRIVGGSDAEKSAKPNATTR